MNCCSASFNSKGFQSSIQSGVLPQPDHITYEGAFNQLSFTIGKKAQKSMQLHIGYAKSQNLESSFDKDVHNYLAIFTKGKKDGEDRDHRILNAVICLDISGSMGSGLTKKGQGHRLQLAKQAIKMFFSKLRQNDSFCLVVFNNTAKTLIESKRKSQLVADQVFKIVDSVSPNGGTTLMAGFQESMFNFLRYAQRQHQQAYEKNQQYVKPKAVQDRIIMLTDVGDNSFGDHHAQKFIEETANSQNIHTTIIGISDDFVSQSCQKLNEIKGFNYFCATQVEDLKKYLFENFSFTFFPANYDIQIELIENKNVKCIEVFGTPDAKKVNQYNDYFKQLNENVVITKTKTSFPSQIQLTKDGVLKQFGGLIIVKLNLQSPNGNKFETKIRLNYKNLNGEKEEEIYPVSFQVPVNEQFYSQESLAEAMPAFFYVHEVRKILQERNKGLGNNKSKEYAESLQKLKGICPKSKLTELQDMIKILNNENQNPYTYNYNYNYNY